MTTSIASSAKCGSVLALFSLAVAIAWLRKIPQAAPWHGRFAFDTPLFTLQRGAAPALAALLTESWDRERAGRDALWNGPGRRCIPVGRRRVACSFRATDMKRLSRADKVVAD